MAVSIQVKLSDKIFLRDPLQTDLGRKIVEQSIVLIERIGFEEFTFKKLAAEIESTEASLYRYFENKHHLLVYLISWYWAWLDYLIEYKTMNMTDPYVKLRTVIKVLAESHRNDPASFIDEALLHKVVVAESEKVYHTKNVDQQNREGFFLNYKSLCARISDIITQINTSYEFPHALSTTIIEAAHNQIFFAQHLPRLTDFKIQDDDYSPLEKFLLSILSGTLDKKF